MAEQPSVSSFREPIRKISALVKYNEDLRRNVMPRDMQQTFMASA